MNGRIVPANATLKGVLVIAMTDMKHITAYFSAMTQARNMLRLGIIDSSDIVSIEDKLAQKYGLNIGSIYREIDLINLEFRANMLSEEVELCQNP